MARPKKIDFSVGAEFKEMLRLALHNKRPEDRIKFYRMLLRDTLQFHLGRKPTKEEIDSAMVNAESKKYSERECHGIGLDFRYKLTTWEYELRQLRAKSGADGKWKKKI